jgi:hypothetical protein
MSFHRRIARASAALFWLAGLQAGPALANERLRVTGEIIDTWCYLSGVMGGPEAVVGSAHHTCAVWCAAGGIPVGMLGDDGKLYMVLKLEGAGTADGQERVLSIQSHKITADGQLYQRDGLNYLVVDRIVDDSGITNRNHTDFGVVPADALPDSAIETLKKQ